MGNSEGGFRPKVCQRCGRTYCGGGYKFCSKECMLGAGVCKRCGREFQRGFVGQRFCRECHGSSGERVCPGCGETFRQATPSQVYCSKECYERSRARVPTPCPVCGKGVPKGRTYCSKECADRARGRMVVCAVCGKEFKGRMHHGQRQKYCSTECQFKARRKREESVCQVCGRTFYPHGLAKGLYCSHQCSGIAMRKEDSKVRCELCGEGFVPKCSSQRFCSKECVVRFRRSEALGYEAQYVRSLRWMARLSAKMGQEDASMRACMVCGEMFVARDTRWKTCSEQCRRAYENARHDKRIYRNGRPDLSINLPALFRRDGGVCKGCGLRMTFDCDPNSDDYPSVDHIVPLARGGLHRWFNVQLMCRGCNSDKRDEMPVGLAPVQTSLDAFAN